MIIFCSNLSSHSLDKPQQKNITNSRVADKVLNFEIQLKV